jgi:RNAse (barnase) inhibitor barstar
MKIRATFKKQLDTFSKKLTEDDINKLEGKTDYLNKSLTVGDRIVFCLIQDEQNGNKFFINVVKILESSIEELEDKFIWIRDTHNMSVYKPKETK